MSRALVLIALIACSAALAGDLVTGAQARLDAARSLREQAESARDAASRDAALARLDDLARSSAERRARLVADLGLLADQRLLASALDRLRARAAAIDARLATMSEEQSRDDLLRRARAARGALARDLDEIAERGRAADAALCARTRETDPARAAAALAVDLRVAAREWNRGSRLVWAARAALDLARPVTVDAILEARGDVEVGAALVRLCPVTISAGDVVQTGERSGATIRLRSGAWLELGTATAVALDDPARGLVTLERGSLRFCAPPRTDAGGALSIGLPLGRVRASSSGASAAALDGLLYASAGAARLALRRGACQLATLDGKERAIEAPRAIDLDADGDAGARAIDDQDFLDVDAALFPDVPEPEGP